MTTVYLSFEQIFDQKGSRPGQDSGDTRDTTRPSQIMKSKGQRQTGVSASLGVDWWPGPSKFSEVSGFSSAS